MAHLGDVRGLQPDEHGVVTAWVEVDRQIPKHRFRAGGMSFSAGTPGAALAAAARYADENIPPMAIIWAEIENPSIGLDEDDEANGAERGFYNDAYTVNLFRID